MTVIATLYPEIVQVVVAAGSPIKSFADLKGKKMGVGAPGSGTEANFRQLLDAYGMKKEDVNAQYLSFLRKRRGIQRQAHRCLSS